ncbi:MAG: serine--tRNA ligase [Anaerolineaceae bacterium]|nr:MAG: serine--tRNA ligase [Anaerolineaceae bacterium]
MIDLRYIREHPDEVKEALRKLHTEAPIDDILQLDSDWREILGELESLRHQRRVASKEIGQMDDQDQRQPLIDEMRGVGVRIADLEERLRDVEHRLQQALYQVPNLPHESVPIGADESENVVIRQEGDPKTAEDFGFEPLPHWELGPRLGILDFERGAKLSGSRFFVMFGLGSRLQRALIQWMLDFHIEKHGYNEVYPPFVVREECMWGAGQLPKFIDNIYHDVEDDLWLIGTGEIPITNLHRDEILEASELPKKYVAHTPCFRREKFSAGRDVRGIKRVHQFDKVEMYKFTTPESSYEELESLLDDAEDICRALEIPHRVSQMVTGDLGFIAAKKYDIEMWAPGSGEWLEVSSCSNCEAFQARRAEIRYRPKPGAKPEHVHTLNGSGLALPRTMIAILENYQQADGSVIVPEVLRSRMGGVEIIKLDVIDV